MDSGLLVNLGKTAIVTVVISRVAKSIGEPEISEIIVATGILACGVYFMVAFMPLVEGIQKFSDNIANGVQGLGNIVDKLNFWN